MDLKFGSAQAAPGSKAWGQIRVREAGMQARIPTVVINGMKSGEHVLFLANQHGGEVNGIESIRRFVEDVDPKKLRGSVFAVPSANPKAAMLANEYYPEDATPEESERYRGGAYRPPDYDRNVCPWNMNRVWPGRKGGNLVERVVYEIWNRGVMAPHRRASLLVDIHCHQSDSAVYCTYRQDIDVAVASGVPTAIYTRAGSSDLHYSRKACRDAGIQSLTFELGRQGRFRPLSVEEGRRGLMNLIKFWGMYPGKLDLPKKVLILDPWRNDIEQKEYARPSCETFTAKKAGLVYLCKGSFEKVKKGDLLYYTIDPATGRVVEEGRSSMTGVMYTPVRSLALVKKGERVCAVSYCRSVSPAEYVKRLNVEDYRNLKPGQVRD